MSVQIALLAPATRVASRKLGPTAGRRGESAVAEQRSRPGATSRLASTCGRCETHAIRRSCVSASIAVGCAPKLVEQAVQPLVEHAGGAAARRRQVPGGAVEQVLARVLDAGGLGPGERMPADEALVGAGARRAARLVEPTSLTTQSGPALAQRRARPSPRAPPTGAATNTTSAPATAPASVAAPACRSRRARAPSRTTCWSGS